VKDYETIDDVDMIASTAINALKETGLKLDKQHEACVEKAIRVEHGGIQCYLNKKRPLEHERRNHAVRRRFRQLEYEIIKELDIDQQQLYTILRKRNATEMPQAETPPQQNLFP